MAFSLTSLIPGFSEASAIATAVVVAVAVAGASYTTYKLTHDVDQGKYETLVANDAKAQTTAIAAAAAKQKALDDAGLKAAVSEAQAQEKIVTQYVTLTKEVPTYVTQAQDAAAAAPGAAPGCVSYGLVRLLDAAVLGVEPATLALPAGKSDDACSPVEPSALAANVTGNYGLGAQNAKQLDDLVAAITAQANIVSAPASK